MKRFALSLAIILAAAALACAAAKTGDSQASGVAVGQTIQAKAGVRPPELKDGAKDGVKDSAKDVARDAARDGDVIIIKGKAGSVPNVDYGRKPEAAPGNAKPGGQ